MFLESALRVLGACLSGPMLTEVVASALVSAAGIVLWVRRARARGHSVREATASAWMAALVSLLLLWSVHAGPSSLPATYVILFMPLVPTVVYASLVLAVSVWAARASARPPARARVANVLAFCVFWPIMGFLSWSIWFTVTVVLVSLL